MKMRIKIKGEVKPSNGRGKERGEAL